MYVEYLQTLEVEPSCMIRTTADFPWSTKAIAQKAFNDVEAVEGIMKNTLPSKIPTGRKKGKKWFSHRMRAGSIVFEDDAEGSLMKRCDLTEISGRDRHMSACVKKPPTK